MVSTIQGRHWRAFIAVLVLLVCAWALLGVNGFKGPRDKYVALLDAGSTGTRIYVYRYNVRDSDLHLTWIPPEAAAEAIPYRPGRRAYNRVETLPGLQSIVAGAMSSNHTDQLRDEVKANVEPLIKWAKAVIPRKRWKMTPIRLLATGGGRGLKAVQQDILIHVVKTILYDSGFSLGEGSVRIMSGHEEGVYGWIALNHELGTFKNTSPVAPSMKEQQKLITLPTEQTNSPNAPILPDPGDFHPDNATEDVYIEEMLDVVSYPVMVPEKRIGALDLGGSSLEVTYPTESEHSAKFDIAGFQYWLASKTFEHLGLNEAFRSSIVLLSEQTNITSSSTMAHPCLHDGYINHPRLPSNPEATVKGAASWPQCLKLAKQVDIHLLHFSRYLRSIFWVASAACKTAPCIKTTTTGVRFYGLNGFYVVWKFFGLSEKASLDLLERQGRAFCQKSWTNVKAEQGDVVQLEHYCFRAAYVSMLLQRILGMSPTEELRVASESVTWPIGAAYLTIQTDWRPPGGRRLGPKGTTSTPRWIQFLAGGVAATTVIVLCIRVLRDSRRRAADDDYDYWSGASSHSISRFRSDHEIKRRTFSYRRLQDLSSP